MVLKIDRTRSLKCNGPILVVGASECIKVCMNWLTTKVRVDDGKKFQKLLVTVDDGYPGYSISDGDSEVLIVGGDDKIDKSKFDLVFRVMRFYRGGVAVTVEKPVVNQCWIVRANDFDELKTLPTAEADRLVRIRRSGLDFPDNAEEFVSHPYRLRGSWTIADLDDLCDYLSVSPIIRQKILEANSGVRR